MIASQFVQAPAPPHCPRLECRATQEYPTAWGPTGPHGCPSGPPAARSTWARLEARRRPREERTMSRAVTTGIDGSQESLAAADWAAGEAALRSCLLRLVYVWKDMAATGAYASDPDIERGAAEALLHDAAEHLRPTHPDLRIETQQKSGSPAEELSGEAPAQKFWSWGREDSAVSEGSSQGGCPWQYSLGRRALWSSSATEPGRKRRRRRIAMTWFSDSTFRGRAPTHWLSPSPQQTGSGAAYRSSTAGPYPRFTGWAQRTWYPHS
ncbi:universal stress protein [Streptomyces clavifer]